MNITVKSYGFYSFNFFLGVITIVLSPLSVAALSCLLSDFFFFNNPCIILLTLEGVALLPIDLIDRFERTEACLDD